MSPLEKVLYNALKSFTSVSLSFSLRSCSNTQGIRFAESLCDKQAYCHLREDEQGFCGWFSSAAFNL